MSRNKLRILAAALLLAASSVLSASASELIPEDEISEETARYRTVKVERGDISSVLSCSATLYTPYQRNVYFEGGQARYVKNAAIERSIVKEGDPIVEVTPIVDNIRIEELKYKQQELDKSWQDAEDARASSRQKYQEDYQIAVTNNDPYMMGILSLQIESLNVEQERAAFEYNEAAANIQEELDKLEAEKEVNSVTAPFDGRISYLQYFLPGTVIDKGTHVATLMDMSKMYLRASNDIPAGREVTITVSYRGQSYDIPGRSVLNCAELSGGVRSGSIIEFDRSFLDLLPDGDITAIEARAVSVMVSYESIGIKDVLTVSADALYKDGITYYAEILDSDNTVHKRPVRVIIYKNTIAWVLDGLSEGDEVVLQ